LHGVTIIPGVENLELPELLNEDWFGVIVAVERQSCGTAEVELKEDGMLTTEKRLADCENIMELQHTATELTGDVQVIGRSTAEVILERNVTFEDVKIAREDDAAKLM